MLIFPTYLSWPIHKHPAMAAGDLFITYRFPYYFCCQIPQSAEKKPPPSA